MSIAKEYIYDGEKKGISIETTRQIIERIYPEGYVNIYNIRDNKRDGRKNSRGSGENSNQIKRNVSLLNTDNIWEAKQSQDMGYHAGDLGKAEPLSIQGGYRGTGHFGAGTLE